MKHWLLTNDIAKATFLRMKLSPFLSQLPKGGRADFAKRVGVSPAYLYQMVRGIRPVPLKRVLAICEASGWKVTPHELCPEIYPHPTDGLPAELRAGEAA